jgi:hypothetical protein
VTTPVHSSRVRVTSTCRGGAESNYVPPISDAQKLHCTSRDHLIRNASRNLGLEGVRHLLHGYAAVLGRCAAHAKYPCHTASRIVHQSSLFPSR